MGGEANLERSVVTRDYLLKKPLPPSPMRLLVNQRLMPLAIDLAGNAEAGLETIAMRTREMPARAVTIAFGVGFVLPFALLSWRGRRG